tara:strand:+ start:45 stop:176 length:132 start_codon:yes stop_codon:yes gene_type:complete
MGGLLVNELEMFICLICGVLAFLLTTIFILDYFNIDYESWGNE